MDRLESDVTFGSDGHSDDSEKQIVLFNNWLDFKGRTTLSILILDRSGSMAEYGSAPVDAVNNHIKRLQEAQDDCAYAFGLISFADTPQNEIDINDVAQIKPLEIMHCEGSTLLYQTVYQTINLLHGRYVNLTDREKSLLKIVIGTLSDGRDNMSPSCQPEMLKTLAEKIQSLGWETLVFGIGVSGKELARKMGFADDDAHAFDLVAERESFADTSITMTQTTMGGWKPRDFGGSPSDRLKSI